MVFDGAVPSERVPAERVRKEVTESRMLLLKLAFKL